MSEYEQFKADPKFKPSTGTILADRRIAELDAENKKAVYGCCEECRALSEAEAKLDALKTNPGPVSDSQCDRCQLDASVRADKAEAERDAKASAYTNTLECLGRQAETISGLEAMNERLDSHTQFWMTAMMAVRFYHELGDEFDCRAAMRSLAEEADRDGGE